MIGNEGKRMNATVAESPAWEEATVRADEDQAPALGIAGMPFRMVESRYAVPGAQPAQTFTQAREQAWRSR